MRVVLALAALTLLALASCGGQTALEAEPTIASTVEPTSVTGAVTAATLEAPTESETEVSSEDTAVTIQNGSVARYRVQEQLARLSVPNDAVGETPDVTGTIVFGADGAVAPDRSRIVVDLSTLKSDENRRDNFLRTDTLESNKYPLAEFTVKDAPGLPQPLPDSGEFTFQLQGDMTLHGVTSPLTWEVTATFTPDSAQGSAQTTFTFDTFNMDKPSLFFILSVEDEIRLELDFIADVTRGATD